MPTEWNELSLSEVCSYIGRGAAPAYTENRGVLVLNQRCVRDQRIDFSLGRRTDPDQRPVATERMLRRFDILVNSTGVGTLGRVAQVHKLPEPATVDSHVTILRSALQIVDPHYLGYAIRSVEADIAALGEGSTGQTELARTRLGSVVIPVPPRDEQRAIAAALGALDDKIEQNRRTAQALERLARAIFRAWFVDFAPVKAKVAGAAGFPSMPQEVFGALPMRFVESKIGPVPEGWEVKAIAKIATFLNGLALQKYPPRGDSEDLRVIKIAQLRKGSTDGAAWANGDVPAQYVIDDRDLLFSWSGTLEAEFWFGGSGALNQHLFKVTSSHYPSWFCFLWIRQHLPWFRAIAASKATTMGHIKREHLQETQVVIPAADVLRAADGAIGPLHDLHAHVMLESRDLAGVRDFLLPKLLSGEVRVQDARGLNGQS